MKDLAIIGASYLQLPLIEKAKELGYVTHVFAWAANDVGEAAADYFYPISIVEKEQILKKCKEIGICGICSIASDLAAVAVNYVAERLNLPGNSMESTLKSTNKHLMRLAFEQNGDPSPKSLYITDTESLEQINMDFPLIVKPTDRSGSRGITKVKTKEELLDAVNLAFSQGFKNEALIEEFAEGKEYSVEGISFNGKHTILAMTEKFTTGAPNFIETGHKEPADLDPVIIEKVKSVVTHALDSLGIKNSASHSEIKIDKNNNIKIIEIGGRMGGDCIGSHLVKYSTGIDYVKAVIDVAVGKQPDLNPVCKPQPIEVRFILNRNDLSEMSRIKDTKEFIELIFLNEENLEKTTDSSNRAGCYILEAL